jgi:prepilin-type N-terminal cleavage/methylation domain-containing protein
MKATKALQWNVQMKMQGFTLVEAMVAMAIFSIGFSGLFFLYGMAQASMAESEKRMQINLMADRIIQTIAAEGKRLASDPLNAFTHPEKYSGNLAACQYPDGDDRQVWCQDLNASIGQMDTASNAEMRQVDVQNDGTGLIVNITLVTSNGKVSAYFSRKLTQ